jgi:hypothetical protein
LVLLLRGNSSQGLRAAFKPSTPAVVNLRIARHSTAKCLIIQFWCKNMGDLIQYGYVLEYARLYDPVYREMCVYLLKMLNLKRRMVLENKKRGDQYLPNETMRIIFEYCSARELCACACVCREWNYETSRETLWLNLLLKVYAFSPSNMIIGSNPPATVAESSSSSSSLSASSLVVSDHIVISHNKFIYRDIHKKFREIVRDRKSAVDMFNFAPSASFTTFTVPRAIFAMA